MTESTTQLTAPAAESVPSQPDAVVDGINVDAVARAVLACAGVSGLSGGRFSEVASYLPGRRIPGVTVDANTVQIQVKARWGVPVRDLYSQITSVLTPVVGRRIDVVIADIDDPPSTITALPALEAATITADIPATTTRGVAPIAS